MNGLLKIDNIMYKVKNLEKAASFYEDILGLKKVWVDTKRKMIGLKLLESDSEIVITSDATLPEFDYSYLVEDVGSFCGKFKEQGFKSELEPIEVRCGKYAILKDLDGNKLPIIDLTKFGNKPRYG